MSENLDSLEWTLLLEQYSAHCFCAPGREKALATMPAPSQEEAELLLSLTEEALRAGEKINFSPLSQITEMKAGLERLKKSLVLEGKELLSISHLSEVMGSLKESLETSESKNSFPLLSLEAQRGFDKRKITAPIRHSIDTDGSVMDSASPTLRGLRNQERKIHSEARDKLDHVLQQAFRDGLLQDKYFDFRDGRYIIPVKTEFRNKVSGFVVESSATKATVFMEPASVRDCNDRLKQVQLQIEEEIYRILTELSLALQPHAEDFLVSYQTCLSLDLIQARGAFARQYSGLRGASRPSFSNNFYLEELYHPLLAFVLPPEKVIRNTFKLGPDKKVLVISGPNTGGKTVLLKAVGLSALMARSGFYLSCAGDARLPFFSQVLSQIGDAQNLELSLSSFSGSILQLKDILESAQKDSLVLVDEILHATDPDEATALSRAILGALQERGSFAIVTTHLNGLKIGDDFSGASMEFDLEKLSPTYRLRVGVPGSSRALEIAYKLGLGKPLIEKARSFLNQDRRKEQDTLDRLELKEKELAATKQKLEEERARYEQEAGQLSALQDELEQQKKTFRIEARSRLQQQEKEALAALEKLSSEYKKSLSSVEEKHQASEQHRRRIAQVKEKFQEAEVSLDVVAPESLKKEETKKEETKALDFTLNGPVKIPSLRTEGVLLSDPANRKGQAEVLVGNLRMRFAWGQIQPREPAVKVKTGSRPYATSSDHADVATELNLIGKTVDEARDIVSLYLDRASRSGRPWVRIVHGHGSGALKKMIRDLLSKSPYELKYRPGTASEGGEGCTVVEFV